MEITLNKEQLEEILISLFFTGFIKDRHDIKCTNTEIIKFFVKEMQEKGLEEFVSMDSNGIPFLSNEITKKTMSLVCLNDGQEVEDIDKTFNDTMEKLSQLVREGKLIIPE